MKTNISCLFFSLFLFLAADARADVTFGFVDIDPNDPTEQNQDVSGQFSFNLSDAGSGQVLFKFFNDGPVDSSVAQIYWEDPDPGLLSDISLDATNTSTGVSFNFDDDANPSNLPQGNNILFVATISSGANPPPSSNGINEGEYLGVLFDGNYDDVLAALQDGSIRVGIHVISIGGDLGFSDAFVNTPGEDPVVPEPASVIVWTALLGLSGMAYRRRQLRQ